MLHFWKTSSPRGLRAGILASAFNPPTLAHLEIARQGMRQYALDELLFLLPQVLPHKEYTGATFDERLEMLTAALQREPRFSIASTDQGLFIDIARACRPFYGPEAEFFFLCGRDAAERIVNWNYGPGVRFADLLSEFQMLVAPRGGPYIPPPEFAARIHTLDWPVDFDEYSSSAVREAIVAGRPWEHLVPAPVASVIRREGLYL